MSRGPHRSLLAVSLLLLTAWGCASIGRPEPQSGGEAMVPADSLAAAVRALEAGDYAEALGPLRWTASRCEAGRYGRRAMLLLAAAALDPRNPDASAEDGAELAARVLALPGTAPDDRTVAEVLYLTALERGAEPPTAEALAGSPGGSPDTAGVLADTAAVDTAAFAPAPRFERCGEAVAGAAPGGLTLPTLPGASMATLLESAQARRDSLSARVTALEAELARIRELLQEAVPVPPDTGSDGGR